MSKVRVLQGVVLSNRVRRITPKGPGVPGVVLRTRLLKQEIDTLVGSLQNSKIYDNQAAFMALGRRVS